MAECAGLGGVEVTVGDEETVEDVSQDVCL